MDTGKLHLNNPILITLMGIISNIPNKKGDLIMIIGIMIISYIIYLLTRLQYSKADIIQNWGDNRCSMSILPIAGYIKPIGKDKTVGLKGTGDNFKYCIDTMSGSFVKVLLEPFMILSNLVVETYSDVFDLINGLNKRAEGLQFNIFGMLLEYIKQIKHIGTILSYVNEKLDSIKAKTVIIIKNIVNFISLILDWCINQIVDSISVCFQTLINLLKSVKTILIIQGVTLGLSIWETSRNVTEIGLTIPFLPFTLPPWLRALLSMIPGVALTITHTLFTSLLLWALYMIKLTLSVFNIDEDILQDMKNQIDDRGGCFTNVNIKMTNGDNKYIKDIIPGDKLYNNGLVKGIIKVHINGNINIYKYRGVDVTGDHIVLHNGQWNRIENIIDDDECSKVTKYVDNLYCLITDNNIININGITFRDYNEINDCYLQSYINYYVKKQVNEECRVNNGTSSSDNLVDYIDHTYIHCFNKFVYEVVKCKNKKNIIGEIVILNTNNIKLYDYLGYILSGNVLVLEDNKWVRVWESNISKPVINDDKYLYHIITNNNEIDIGDDNPIKIRDFKESNNNILNEKIDKMVLTNLNEYN